ncbi:hypothetical protein [Mycobacterium sp. MMS18-G62]
MTALQDWLSIRPDPKTLKAFICEALRGITDDEPAKPAEPALLRRGVERC